MIRSRASALHLFCTGSGAPTVLLEAGLGGNYLDWSLVQPELARITRVCSYDRAGAGWSEASERPRTLDNIADELHGMLSVAALDRPLILVGHSFGGLCALHYASRFPREVAGLVLLDSTHPDQFVRFREAGVRLPDPGRAAALTPASAATYGLPPDLSRTALDLAAAPKARIAMVREASAMPVNADVVSHEVIPQVPVRVVVHGNREWDHLYPDGRMETAWLGMQRDLARELHAPPPIIAVRSGHQIALDDPDVVLRAIGDLIRTLRGKAAAKSDGPQANGR
jgi:pimeloyl-ACP methyl ester carboxylesterase